MCGSDTVILGKHEHFLRGSVQHGNKSYPAVLTGIVVRRKAERYVIRSAVIDGKPVCKGRRISVAVILCERIWL